MPGTKGNKNSSLENRAFAKSLKRMLTQYKNGHVRQGDALNGITTRLIEKALEGESWAIGMVGDRLDGKPAQAITGEDGEPFVIHLQNTDVDL